jgi:hypothetical protein
LTILIVLSRTVFCTSSPDRTGNSAIVGKICENSVFDERLRTADRSTNRLDVYRGGSRFRGHRCWCQNDGKLVALSLTRVPAVVEENVRTLTGSVDLNTSYHRRTTHIQFKMCQTSTAMIYEKRGFRS